MDSVYFLLALAIILALFWTAKQRRIAAIRHVLNRVVMCSDRLQPRSVKMAN